MLARPRALSSSGLYSATSSGLLPPNPADFPFLHFHRICTKPHHVYRTRQAALALHLSPAVLLIWTTILPPTFQSCLLAGLIPTLFFYESSPLSLSIKRWYFISDSLSFSRLLLSSGPSEQKHCLCVNCKKAFILSRPMNCKKMAPVILSAGHFRAVRRLCTRTWPTCLSDSFENSLLSVKRPKPQRLHESRVHSLFPPARF